MPVINIKQIFNTRPTSMRSHHLVLKVYILLFCVLQIIRETYQKHKLNLDKIKNLKKNLTDVSFDISIFHAGYTPWLHFNFTANFLNDQIQNT